MRALTTTDEQMGRILKALEGLKYGSVLITVHDSHIVQIDRTEKQRFSLEPASFAKPSGRKNQKKRENR
ncbi:YezD family protein [Paenactinomyces guangxiensis]|uniref:YezD family protein n=1 Tax=Paenactinomyces guangxiensis TaxID=1490290 RepID=A0A7W1WQ89_9BACL|nr:YezD family protein [Paenactinomyces guangxiensis]MBA4493934.1 YezD family protein [Paenactinomyces guangxiensis]MBH8591401.1 YezD family protein [Paenactinomyces guangxiensis]